MNAFQNFTKALIKNLAHCADAFQSLQLCAQDEQDYSCYTPLTFKKTRNYKQCLFSDTNLVFTPESDAFVVGDAKKRHKWFAFYS